jgi:hypothetical protein
MDQGPGEMMERYVVGWACIRNLGYSNLLSFMFVNLIIDKHRE